MSTERFISYDETIERTGLPKRTLLDRIERSGVLVYKDGRDRRRRLIDVRDLPLLTEPIPVRDLAAGREHDGSGA